MVEMKHQTKQLDFDNYEISREKMMTMNPADLFKALENVKQRDRVESQFIDQNA